jgi:hypothetical protein
MNIHDAHQASIISRLGFRVVGQSGLGPLAFSSLPDHVLVETMRLISLGLDPGFNLADFAISEEEWLRRRQGRRLAREIDPDRRRIRKARKRRHRHR